MRHITIGLVAVISLTIAVSARAQGPDGVQQAAASRPADLRVMSPGQVEATPEMWFYEQEMRRYEDPKTAARARAEAKSNQRLARLAAMKWYGISNSRPRVGTDVMHGMYSAQWVGNGYPSTAWVAPAPTIVVTPERR